MITPELVAYIRGEFAKGKTREEIHAALTAEGGWSETDLNEAFRVVVPMQSFAQTSLTSKPKTSPHFLKFILIFIILGAIAAGIWFYRSSITGLWNSVMHPAPTVETPETPTVTAPPVVTPPPVVTNPNAVQNCGVGIKPDLKTPATYENDGVLSCLGNSALTCQNAQATLQDDLFPTIFQVIKSGDSCSLRLSYPDDSTLVDLTGKRLAGQYISCPLSIVKEVDESDPKATVFKDPSTGDLGKYAAQIYFYGTLGVFIQNNLDPAKIQAAGCTGPYIDSVIAGYKKALGKK